MASKMGSLIEAIGNFFTGGDQKPWCDRDNIAGCERKLAEATKATDSDDDSDEWKTECLLRLLWALVYAREKEDIQRGINMLETSLDNDKSHQKEKLYLLAFGYNRFNDYARSRQLVEQCLEIAPDCGLALALKKEVEDRIAKDGAIGIGITATVVGLIGVGVAAALARRN